MNVSKYLLQITGLMLVTVSLTGRIVPSVMPLLAPMPLPASSTAPTVPCSLADTVPMGVLRSTDNGATWTFLGDVCMPNTGILPADPTGLVLGNTVVLYFVDFLTLNLKGSHYIYRATSLDGVNFNKPQAVYQQSAAMVDPAVLLMPDGKFHLWAPSEKSRPGIPGKGVTVTAISFDGLEFSLVAVKSPPNGGMPGALLWREGVRMFVCGGGISSYRSYDGFNFFPENGWRIPPPPIGALDNPQPIRLIDESYLMLYQSYDPLYVGPDPWKKDIHLATSLDASTWITNSAVIATGGTSTIVQLPDGTLLIYYGH